MGRFFEETMQGLLEAVEIEKGGTLLKQKENMPAPTFTVSNQEKELISQMVQLRKVQKLSQKQIAELVCTSPPSGRVSARQSAE